MLYTAAVSAATLEHLTKLMQDVQLMQFVLVGETFLALQIGHRVSVDLDLFSNESFDKYPCINFGIECCSDEDMVKVLLIRCLIFL